MLITLHDESIDVEIGQKVIFYGYHFSKDNHIEVTADETIVDVIDEKLNIIGFKNEFHSCTLRFYENDLFGERYFLSDTNENRLRFLKSKVKRYEAKQAQCDYDITEACEVLERYMKNRRELTNGIRIVNNLIEQLSEAK